MPSETRQLLFLLTLAAFASSASFRVCDPMLPQLAGQFAASTAEVALIITGFTIAYGAMQLIYGPLGERFERFRIVTRATALCAVGSLGAALAPSLEMLTACRILTGVAAAGIIPMSMATVSDLVPAEQRQAPSPASSRGRFSAWCSARCWAACAWTSASGGWPSGCSPGCTC
jgi:predicted MFS family arabinose efflux permease